MRDTVKYPAFFMELLGSEECMLRENKVLLQYSLSKKCTNRQNGLYTFLSFMRVWRGRLHSLFRWQFMRHSVCYNGKPPMLLLHFATLFITDNTYYRKQ